eukprot:3076454-Rhodomonas_salina.2
MSPSGVWNSRGIAEVLVGGSGPTERTRECQVHHYRHETTLGDKRLQCKQQAKSRGVVAHTPSLITVLGNVKPVILSNRLPIVCAERKEYGNVASLSMLVT